MSATEPMTPSTVAWTSASPSPTAVTRPVGVTVATSGLVLVHSTGRPSSTPPPSSRAVTVSCTTSPT